MRQISPEELQRAVAAREEQAREWLMQMIAYPSVQGQEAPLMAYLYELCGALGLPAEMRELPDSLREDPEYSHGEAEGPYAGRPNLVCRLPGTGGGRSVIVQSHADVIPGGDWKQAFEPRWDGEHVHGRGATDCKGCLVTMLLAVAALRDLGVELAGDVELQMVIEEEPGGNGALALIRQGGRADGVIVVEASEFNVYCAGRGALWFRLQTEGVSAHMGRRHEAVNAIEKMMEAMRLLLDYEQRLIAESRGHPLFARYESPVQVCLGMIQGGTWPSRVPDECVLEGGVGFLPNKPMQRIREELVELMESSEDEWLRTHYELTHDKLHNDSYELDPAHPLVTTLHGAVQECGLESVVEGWNVSCDARLYARLAGLPTVVFGPGSIRDAHATGEKIRWAQVPQAATGLALGLVRWCGSGED